MKIGIVGYQGSGKSTLFEWLTGETVDPSLAHTTQSAMATVNDARVMALCDIYRPKKVSQAALELVDTPGLSRTHEGSGARLTMIREAGCLVMVVAAYGPHEALADISNLDDDLLLADLEIVSGRVERLHEQLKKPRPNRDALLKELETLEPMRAALEEGRHLRDLELTPEQQRITRAFQLFSEKPRLVVFNIADDEEQPERFRCGVTSGVGVETVSLSLQLELARMEDAEREEFCRGLGLVQFDRDSLLHRIMHVSGQMLFFTVGDREVRSWMIRQGGTAVEAAGLIHTDLARGFIRAETMTCDDLLRLGSEREVKAQHLMRQEHKDYVVQQGEILLIRHN